MRACVLVCMCVCCVRVHCSRLLIGHQRKNLIHCCLTFSLNSPLFFALFACSGTKRRATAAEVFACIRLQQAHREWKENRLQVRKWGKKRKGEMLMKGGSGSLFDARDGCWFTPQMSWSVRHRERDECRQCRSGNGAILEVFACVHVCVLCVREREKERHCVLVSVSESE
jgi:hypothetical protein